MYTLRMYLLLIFLYLIRENSAGTSNHITITLERANLECDNESLNNCSCNVRRFNRTSPYMLDIYMHVAKPIGRNISVVFKSFEWKNNQFKESFITFNKNMCDFLEADVWLQAMIKDYGNIPYKCPVEVGLYYMKDFRVIESRFPIGFPAAKWKFSYAFQFKITKKPILQFSIEFKVEKILQRKKG